MGKYLHLYKFHQHIDKDAQEIRINLSHLESFIQLVLLSVQFLDVIRVLLGARDDQNILEMIDHKLVNTRQSH